jgi:hypothetical protein
MSFCGGWVTAKERTGTVYKRITKHHQKIKIYDLLGVNLRYVILSIAVTDAWTYFRRSTQFILYFFAWKQVVFKYLKSILYGVHKLPNCLSLRRNWVPPPLPPRECVSPPLDPKGEEQHSMRVREGPNSDDYKESLAFCILYKCTVHCDWITP